MSKGQLGVMVTEAPDPVVEVATCCKAQPGLTVRVAGQWRLLVHMQNALGDIGTKAHKIAVCRGCWQPLGDATPTRPWTFDEDEAADNHLRQIAREVRSHSLSGSQPSHSPSRRGDGL